MNRSFTLKLFSALAALVWVVAAIALSMSSSAVHTHAQDAVTITEFPVPTSNSQPDSITAGPDGNLWFTELSARKIGSITPNGTITEFPPLTFDYSPQAITAGPDGNLWFTEGDPLQPAIQIGRITPSGVVTNFPIPTSNLTGINLPGITAGPDGNLWFTMREENQIGRITPSGTITEFAIPTANTFPQGIAAGPDGNLWFTEPTADGSGQIGRITPSGIITEFAIPTTNSGASGIAAGPDGNLWFTEGSANQIGRITPSGTITEFPLPTANSQPSGITAGPDGNLWFTESNPTIVNQIGRITPSGTITEFPVPTANNESYGIASGPDGNLWFTEADGNKIGRVNLSSTTPQLIKLSSDPYPPNGTSNTSEYQTEVEPDTFSFGSTIVSAFQVGRFSDGGSANIGWATSTDKGSTWNRRFLPGITKVVNSANPYDRVSDASVAYDAAHKVWMIASLGVTIINGSPIGSAVLVSRSADGLSWNKPVKVASAGSFSDLDKPWVVCDNTATSKFYGHCYIEWDNHGRNGGEFYFNGRMLMSTSTNGGLTWGSQQHSADTAHGIGGQPLVQPNGTVIVPFLRTFLTSSEQDIAAFTSTDGGTSWSNTVTIAIAKMHTVGGNLRSDLPQPSAEIDGSGKVYVVWSDCQLEPNCSTNDIVMSSSTDGVKWNGVTVIPLDPFGTSVDHFIPGIAVDKSTSGSTAHLVLTFYYYPVASCTTNCQLYVGFASSTNGGNHWSARTKLAGPMTLSWLANTTLGYMVGDYISASFSGGKAYPVFAVAKIPSGGVLNEAMYTVVGGLS